MSCWIQRPNSLTLCSYIIFSFNKSLHKWVKFSSIFNLFEILVTGVVIDVKTNLGTL